jgi:FAD/FMN-containing dehydrogenase
MRDRLSSLMSTGSVTRVLGFGHVGDGNVHLNITGPAFDANVLHAIEPFLYEWIRQHKGSISAEHGEE